MPDADHDTLIDSLVACHACDHLHRRAPLPRGGKALCAHCGSLLYRHVPDSVNRALAFNLTALVLFILANAYPFISLKLGGRIEDNVLVSGALAMYREGMAELAVLVLLTSAVFPFLSIAGSLYVLLPLRAGFRPPAMARVFRMVKAVSPWSLTGVFMLGVLISFVKLLDLATVIPGVSLYAFAGLLVTMVAASVSLDESEIWASTGIASNVNARRARAVDQALISCHSCGLLLQMPRAERDARALCPRCETPLHGARKVNSVARTWALIAAAAILLIPANVFPVMTVTRFGQGEPNTILSGVLHLMHSGMWVLAFIVFFASIVVPCAKLVTLSYLLISIRRASSWRPRDRTRLYRITEVIGAWSMVDIFIVAILTALVSLDALATISPGVGASFFAAVVVTTMFAAQSFDPRLIWDHRGDAR